MPWISERDPETGRFLPIGRPAEQSPKRRDPRSDRRTSRHPGAVNFRMPVAWRRILDMIAQQRNLPLTCVLLEAIEPVVMPALQAQQQLRDNSSPETPGLPRRTERLADRLPSTVTPAAPKFDHLTTQNNTQKRRKPKFTGSLVDGKSNANAVKGD